LIGAAVFDSKILSIEGSSLYWQNVNKARKRPKGIPWALSYGREEDWLQSSLWLLRWNEASHFFFLLSKVEFFFSFTTH
jgi:hypothetical protein